MLFTVLKFMYRNPMEPYQDTTERNKRQFWSTDITRYEQLPPPISISYYLTKQFQFEVPPGISVRDNWQFHLIDFCPFKENLMRIQSFW